MIVDAFNLIKTAWYSISSWIWNVWDAMGAWSYMMGAIFAMLVVRNIVYPAMKEGVGASDGAMRETPNQKGSNYIHVNGAYHKQEAIPPSVRNKKKLNA